MLIIYLFSTLQFHVFTYEFEFKKQDCVLTYVIVVCRRASGVRSIYMCKSYENRQNETKT